MAAARDSGITTMRLSDDDAEGGNGAESCPALRDLATCAPRTRLFHRPTITVPVVTTLAPARGGPSV